MDDRRARLRRRFLRLSALNVASNLTVPVASLVDTAMLGHLDEIRFLAGVALAAVIFDYLYWAFGFLRMGTTGLVAMAEGRGDKDEAVRIFYRSAVVGLSIGTAALLLAPVLRELGFALLSGSAASEAVGRQYFNARILGAPAVFANLALAGYFIGTGKSGQALSMAIVQNIGNATLNVWFIWKLGWAAEGAGLAAMASQYLASLVGTIAFVAGRPPLRQRDLFSRAGFTTLFRLNGELFIRTLSMLTVFALFTNLSALGGEAQLAAFAILIRILTAGAYIIDGAAFALESLVGGLWHERRYDDLAWLLRLALTIGLGTAALIALALAVAGPTVYAALTEHHDVIALSVRYQPWMLVTLGFGAIAWILDGLFIGLTWGKELRRAALVSMAVFLPGALLAERGGGPHVLWAAFLLFTVARSVTLSWTWAYAFPAAGDEKHGSDL
ncbi:MAG: MATE family efflux transporter [Myxococcota bacterium]